VGECEGEVVGEEVEREKCDRNNGPHWVCGCLSPACWFVCVCAPVYVRACLCMCISMCMTFVCDVCDVCVQVPPSWHYLTECKALDAIDSSHFPGAILFSLRFGLSVDAPDANQADGVFLFFVSHVF
jgi:hypothetical protein